MAPPLVQVVGSVNVDLVVSAARLPGPGETVAGGTFARHGGGKGANQAVAAARLGARVRLVGAVGDDELGEGSLGLLEREGVDVSAVERLERVPTGVALIVVDEAGENQIAVASGANAELGAASAGRAVEPDGGVVLLGLEVGDEAVLSGALAAREAGLALVLDPAPARPLGDELLGLAPLLTPNAAEACALAGVSEPEAAARVLARRSGAPVVVTLGAHGALVIDGTSMEHVPALRLRSVDSTGAGDAFAGALACELATGAELSAAVRFAVAAAGLSTLEHGAREGMPDRASVEAALR
jgi:ribokinase